MGVGYGLQMLSSATIIPSPDLLSSSATLLMFMPDPLVKNARIFLLVNLHALLETSR
jgi:hypothetical protein